MPNVYRIRVAGIPPLICKVTETIQYGGKIDYTILIGGKKTFCFIASVNSKTPTKAYIDRLEYNEACVEDGSLIEKGGTVKLILASLWTVVTLFPYITYFDLVDDAHIYCSKDSKLIKLNLSYDYILKYGETWYEKLFSAVLPSDIIIEDGKETTIYDKYAASLEILDEPLLSYDIMVLKLNSISFNELEYKSATSPRDFINKLRIKYGSDYCSKVGPWLSWYMKSLGIKLYNDLWKIYPKHLTKPDKYNIIRIDPSSIGGRRKKTNTNRTLKRKQFSLIKGGNSEPCVGYFNTFE